MNISIPARFREDAAFIAVAAVAIGIAADPTRRPVVPPVDRERQRLPACMTVRVALAQT